MSFTSDIKRELCDIKTPTCCKIAECYGILLFGRTFSANAITLTTESEDVVNRLIMLLLQCYGVSPNITGGGVRRDTFSVAVNNEAKCKEILTSLGYFGYTKGDRVIKSQNIEEECCMSSFIRGAFLSCGMVSDPNKDYHAEFLIHNETLAKEFYDLLKQNGLSPSISKRGKNTVVYFKESGNIEDLLTTINATNHTLELAGIKVYKDMRNYYNRLNNCETANITKTVNAAIIQNRAIEILENSGELENLTDELKFAAKLRKDNPEASLSELCNIAKESITKSGLNHRLNRLVSLAKNIEN